MSLRTPLQTSTLLHCSPDDVRDGRGNADWVAPDRTHLRLIGMRGYTGSGLIGRPSLANVEKGPMSSLRMPCCAGETSPADMGASPLLVLGTQLPETKHADRG